MSAYYDRQGQLITEAEWLALFAITSYRRVALHLVGDSTIHTVWLGADDGRTAEARTGAAPYIFQTQVYGGELALQRALYATEAEAFAGHADMLARVLRVERSGKH